MTLEKKVLLYKQIQVLLEDLNSTDAALRQKYEIGDKFRFIKDKLTNLLKHYEEYHLVNIGTNLEQEKSMPVNPILVYVHLFNVGGVSLENWVTMINPRVFYEYSVNRPIYLQKKTIEAIIQSKANSQQHGFLTVLINKEDILTEIKNKDELSFYKESIKIKEGALLFNHLVSFTHQNKEYTLQQNTLIEKN